jgi:hypothetical protein
MEINRVSILRDVDIGSKILTSSLNIIDAKYKRAIYQTSIDLLKSLIGKLLGPG